jgi:hypothetical protein
MKNLKRLFSTRNERATRYGQGRDSKKRKNRKNRSRKGFQFKDSFFDEFPSFYVLFDD